MRADANGAPGPPTAQGVVPAPDEGAIIAVEERRRMLARAAANCCYCIVLMCFVFLLILAPDVAILFMIVFLGLFFVALVLNQIQLRRAAYLRGVAAAQYERNAQQRLQQPGNGNHDAPRVGGFMYNERSGEVVPIMVVPEGSGGNSSRRNVAGSGVRTPGVAIYQTPTLVQNTSNGSGGGGGSGKEEESERQDGDRIYGRGAYLSSAPPGAVLHPNLKPDYEEVREEDEVAAEEQGKSNSSHRRAEGEKPSAPSRSPPPIAREENQVPQQQQQQQAASWGPQRITTTHPSPTLQSPTTTLSSSARQQQHVWPGQPPTSSPLSPPPSAAPLATTEAADTITSPSGQETHEEEADRDGATHVVVVHDSPTQARQPDLS